jgi:hypothetical protein
MGWKESENLKLVTGKPETGHPKLETGNFYTSFTLS